MAIGVEGVSLPTCTQRYPSDCSDTPPWEHGSQIQQAYLHEVSGIKEGLGSARDEEKRVGKLQGAFGEEERGQTTLKDVLGARGRGLESLMAMAWKLQEALGMK